MLCSITFPTPYAFALVYTVTYVLCSTCVYIYNSFSEQDPELILSEALYMIIYVKQNADV